MNVNIVIKSLLNPIVLFKNMLKFLTLLKSWLINVLSRVRSFKDIAADFNISSSTVIRILDQHTVQKRLPLSETIAIDEFKKTNLGMVNMLLLSLTQSKLKIIDVMKK